MRIPFNRSPATCLLVLSFVVTAIQLSFSALVSDAISPDTMIYLIGLAGARQTGDQRHLIAVGNFVHQTPRAELIVLPIYVTPGIISNGVANE